MKINEDLQVFTFGPPENFENHVGRRPREPRKENEKCVWVDRTQGGALRTLTTMWAEDQGNREKKMRSVCGLTGHKEEH